VAPRLPGSLDEVVLHLIGGNDRQPLGLGLTLLRLGLAPWGRILKNVGHHVAPLRRFDRGHGVSFLPWPLRRRLAGDLHRLGWEVWGVQIGLQARQERVCVLLRIGGDGLEKYADRLQHNDGAAGKESQRDCGGQQPLEHRLPPILKGPFRAPCSREVLRTG
jgi:hypothetical protein